MRIHIHYLFFIIIYIFLKRYRQKCIELVVCIKQWVIVLVDVESSQLRFTYD